MEIINFPLKETLWMELMQIALVLMILSGVVYWFRRRSGDPKAESDYHRDTSAIINAFWNTGWKVFVTGAGSAFAFLFGLFCLQTSDPLWISTGAIGAAIIIASLPLSENYSGLPMIATVTFSAAVGISLGLSNPSAEATVAIVGVALWQISSFVLGILMAVWIVTQLIRFIAWFMVMMDGEEDGQPRWVHPWLRPLYTRLSKLTEASRERERLHLEKRKARFAAMTKEQKEFRASIVALLFGLLISFAGAGFMLLISSAPNPPDNMEILLSVFAIALVFAVGSSIALVIVSWRKAKTSQPAEPATS